MSDEGTRKQLKIEEALELYDTIEIEPKGYSMYPFFVPGRDAAVIKKIGQHKCRRGDVLLFRRTDGRLVLHRLCKVRADGFYLVGDNQECIEGPILHEQVLGILIARVRGDKRMGVHNIAYQCYARLWLLLRPIRPFLKKSVAKIKRLFGRK